MGFALVWLLIGTFDDRFRGVDLKMVIYSALESEVSCTDRLRSLVPFFRRVYARHSKTEFRVFIIVWFRKRVSLCET